MAALTLDDSIDHAVTTPALYGADFDAIVSNFEYRDELAASEELAADAAIEAVGLGWSELPSPNSTPVRVVGPRGSTNVEPSVTENVKGTISWCRPQGRAPLRADEAAIGRTVMNEIGAHIGDRVDRDG